MKLPRFYKTLFITLLLAVGIFVAFHTVSAQNFGLNQIEDNTTLASGDIRIVVARIIRAVLGLLGIIAVVLVLYAGFIYMTSGGDEEKIGQARKLLTNAVIGLAIILSSFAIVQFVISRLSDATGSGVFDPSLTCSDPIYASLAENREECNPENNSWSCDDNPIYCASRSFVVKSITPQTANGNINDVVVRLVFSRPVDTAADKVITIKRDNNDVTNEFVYSYAGGTDNVVLEANYKPELSQCKDDNAVCMPVGIYAVSVNTDTVVDRRGERLKAKVDNITFPTITSFTLTTIKKIDFQAPRITGLQINRKTGDKISLARGATYPVSARIEDNAGISYVRMSIQRQGSAGSFTIYEGPLETSNSPYDFSYPFVLSSNAILRDKYTVTVQAYDINHLSAQASFEVMVLGEHCSNGEQDGDETGTDSGGSCSADAGCKSDIECTSRICDERVGICINAPLIEDVSPWNGKPGNWITIEGKNFGSSAGKVEFGTDTDNDGVIEQTDEWTEARLAQCTIGSAWNNNYIVTVVPVTPKRVFTQNVETREEVPQIVDILAKAGLSSPYKVNALGDVKVVPETADIYDWADSTTTIRYSLDTTPDNGYGPIDSQGLRTTNRMIARKSGALQVVVWERWFQNNGDRYRWFSFSFRPVGKNFNVELFDVVEQRQWKTTDTYSIVTRGGKTYLYNGDRLVQTYDGVFDPGVVSNGQPLYLGATGTDAQYADSVLRGRIEEFAIHKAGQIKVGNKPVEVDAVLKNNVSIRVTLPNADVRHYEFFRDVTTDTSKPRPAGWADNGLFTLNDISRPGLCGVVTEAAGIRAGSPNTDVVASGSGFGDRAGESAIAFGSGDQTKEGTIRSWTGTEIKTKVPQNITPKKVPVTVTASSGEMSNSVPFTILPVSGDLKPDVISVDPVSSTPGSMITISGLRFGDSGGAVYLAPREGVTCSNAADGCVALSLPDQCGDTWLSSRIIATVPKVGVATYVLVVKNNDLVASNGDVRFGVLEDTGPHPGICQLDPDNGSAPRRDLNIVGAGLVNTNANQSDVPTVYFWKRGATGNLATWLASNTHTSYTNTRIITDIPSENGYSMPTGPGPIKVRVNGKDSNSLIYTVGDCTLMKPESIPSGTQCCRVGKEKGSLKSTDQVCEGETREAGYVWRFTTGKISSVPHVVENECPLQGGAIQFPSPTPWSQRKNGSGVNACTTASIAVKFSLPMDPATLNSDTVKVYTCATKSNKQANCEGTNKKPVDGNLTLRYAAQILTIREVPDVAPLQKDTWYRVELSKKIVSKEPVTELGVATLNQKPLQVSRPCGVETAYCFEFKTGNDECELMGAGIEPPSYTTKLLGRIADPAGSQNPFYFTLWGKAKQECSVVSVANRDWDWTSNDESKVTVTAVAPGTSRAMIDALADTGDTPVDITATLFSPRQVGNTTITEKLVATTTITVELGKPTLLKKWPECTDACVNASIGVTFSRKMIKDDYIQGVVLRKCSDSSCTAFETGPIAFTPSPLSDDTTFRFTPNETLEKNSWYLVELSNTIRSIGQIKPSLNGGAPTIVPGLTIDAEKWKFKTKDTDELCQVEDVSVIPLNFTARMIKQRTQYGAAPLGAPDACSQQQGQELDPWKYGWNWSVKKSDTDITDTSVATVTNFISAGEPKSYCSASCLPLGSIIPFGAANDVLCGNGTIDAGEDCDIGIDTEVAGQSCTYRCLRPGNTNKGTDATKPVCGNGVLNTQQGEECDPADPQIGKYCTDSCTYKPAIVEDSAQLCGDREIDKRAGRSIEDCDSNSNTLRCSASCVNLGTSLMAGWCVGNLTETDIKACRMAQSVCGNKIVEVGEECEVGANGKLPSTCDSRCLLKNVCDDDNLRQCLKGTPGCNDDCTFAGASVLYETPSLCGDGVRGFGESPRCELDMPEDALGQNPVQLVEAVGLGTVVSEQQTADIMATIVTQRVGMTKKPVSPAVSSVGKYSLQCGYTEYPTPRVKENDEPSYNDCPDISNGLVDGVASNSCCYPRPHRIGEYPADGAGFAGVETPLEALRSSLMSFQSTYPVAYAARRDTFTDVIEEQKLFEKIQSAVGTIDKYLAASDLDRNDMADEVMAEITKYRVALDAAMGVFGNEQKHAPTTAAFRAVSDSMGAVHVWLIPLQHDNAFEPVTEAWGEVKNAVQLDASEYTATPMDVRSQFILLLTAAENFDNGTAHVGFDRITDEERRRSAQALLKASDDFQQVYAQYKTSQSNISLDATLSALERFSEDVAPTVSGGGVCRNTLITVVLNDEINPETVLGNIMIASATTTPTCATGTVDVSNEVRATLAFDDASDNVFIRVFQTIKNFFFRLFNKDVYASQYPLSNKYHWCAGAITATPQVNTLLNNGNKETTITLALNQLLDRETYYAVVLRGGALGIKSVRGVGITSQQKDELTDSWMFRTGKEICKIDRIRLTPESQLFTKSNQSLPFTAYAESKNGSTITPIKGAYDWVWSWGPQNHPVFAIPATGAPTNTARTLIASKTVEGQITAVVSARVIADSDTEPTTSHLGTIVSDTTELISDFCENPWSGGQESFPYRNYTYNYSMSYCADAGVQGTRSDDLPYLRIQTILLSDADRARGELSKALLVDATSTDAIGIRVLRNEEFLPAGEWYAAAFPGARAPESLVIAGYDTVKDGDTYYISFLNLSNGQVFNNILVLTLNTGAQAPIRKVFEQLLETLKFNVNIKELGYCLNENGELRDDKKVANISSLACSTDFDCRDANGVPKTGTVGICANARTKFQRDWKRLHEIAAIQEKLEQYHDDQNRGNGSYPTLSSGTFIPQYTASYWPSWGTLSTLLKGIPKDQIEKKTLCEDPSAEQSTCWNAASSTYSCPKYSSTYEYAFNTSTKDYMLYGRLEYFGKNEGTVTGLIDVGHFTNGPWCQPSQRYSPFGEKCGDGVVQTQRGEECEGATIVTGAACATGVMQKVCNPATCRYQAEACVAVGRCGDGVTQAGEECDDGARNNQFGHCQNVNGQCKRPTAFCGNGTLDVGERCDASAENGTRWFSYNTDKNKSCSFDCQGYGGYCGDDIKQGDEQCEAGSVQNTTERCEKVGSAWWNDAPDVVKADVHNRTAAQSDADPYYATNDGIGYSEGNHSFYYTFPLEQGSYEFSIQAFNYPGDDFSDERNVQDGACSNIPGVQLHYRLTVFDVSKPNDPGKYVGDTCINALPRSAAPASRTGKIKTGTLSKGTYRFVATWDNDWGRDLTIPEDGPDLAAIQLKANGRGVKSDGTNTTRPGDGIADIDTDAAIEKVYLSATKRYVCDKNKCTYINQDVCPPDANNSTSCGNDLDNNGYVCVPSASTQVAAPAGSCGDGVKQNNEVCDAGLERNENGRTVGNGVICQPGYGNACSYCSNDCKQLLTIDATAYCGNGRIDQINQSGSSPVYEACDFAPGANGVTQIVSSTASGTAVGAPSCSVSGSVGGYSCNATCTALVNSCLACVPIEGGGAIPKIAVLNVLTPSSTLLNAEWGRTTEKELYRKALTPTSLGYSSLWDIIPKGPVLNEDIDYRKYTDQQWMFTEGFFFYVPSDPKYVPEYLSAYHGIEANAQCGDTYAVYFNKGAIDRVGDDENLQNPTKGSFFDYPVAGQSSVVENELVVTPVPRPGEFRVVVRWQNDEKNIKLGGIVYNDETYGGGGVNTGASIFYNVAAAKANNTLCNAMMLSGGSTTAEQNRYWVPIKACGIGVFADVTHQRDDMLHYGSDAASYCSNGVQCSFDHLLYMYEMGSIAHTSAQSLTINAGLPLTINPQYFGTTQPKPYAYVVEGISGPLSEYLNKNVYVDVYIGGKAGVVPRYSIYKPDYTFSMREAAVEGSTSNRNFKYWHVFNIVKDGNTYKISTSTTGLNGSLETEWDSPSRTSGVLGNYRRQQ